MAAFRGVFSIPVTPFDERDELDEASLRRCTEFCVEAGAHGIVAPVVASEFATLTDAERLRVAEIVTEVTNRRIPVVIGVAGVSNQHAVLFARHAREIGADAVIAMPPYVHKATISEIFEYYRVIAEESQLPVFIQNFPAPIGTPLPAPILAELVQQIEGVSYIKEETPLSGHIMTAVRETAGVQLKGVMGGMAGRFLMDEYRRGACGTMPACEVTDIHAAVWNALETGDEPHARQIFRRLLPLLDFEMLHGVAVCKQILYRRGVITSTTMRGPGMSRLDQSDLRELDILLADLDEFFITAPLTR